LAATSDVRDWHTKLREILRCQAVQALIYCQAQFEGDAKRNVQPMQIFMEDVRQTPVELPSTSDARCGLLLQTEWRGRSVCLSVVSPANTTLAGPRNQVSDGVNIGRTHSQPGGVTSRRCGLSLKFSDYLFLTITLVFLGVVDFFYNFCSNGNRNNTLQNSYKIYNFALAAN